MGDLATDLPSVYSILKPYLDFVNSFLSRFVPSFENIIILAVSFMISYMLCNKYNWTRFSMVFFTISFYSFFRYLTIGVP